MLPLFITRSIFINTLICSKNYYTNNVRLNKVLLSTIDTPSFNNMIDLHHIDLFYTKSSKNLNDKNNKIRENILTDIHNLPNNYFEDTNYGDKWYQLKNKWNDVIDKLSNVNYNSTSIIKMAGRKYNYDFKILYKYDNVIIDTKKIEFKYNPIPKIDLTEGLTMSDSYENPHKKYLYLQDIRG
jgi:hypothetical protein